MSTPEDGKELRKFYMKNVKEFNFYGKTAEATIQVEASDFLDRVKAHGNRVFDVKRSFNIHTVNTMFGILFGIRMEQDDEKFQELLKMIQMYMDFPSTVGRLCFILPRLADFVPSFLSGKKFVEKFVLSFVSVVERHLETFLQSRVPEQPRNYTDALMDKVDVTTDETSVFHSSQKTNKPTQLLKEVVSLLAIHLTLRWGEKTDELIEKQTADLKSFSKWLRNVSNSLFLTGIRKKTGGKYEKRGGRSKQNKKETIMTASAATVKKTYKLIFFNESEYSKDDSCKKAKCMTVDQRWVSSRLPGFGSLLASIKTRKRGRINKCVIMTNCYIIKNLLNVEWGYVKVKTVQVVNLLIVNELLL
ncbi:unnamed protein product [Allacma fusca]|uniref:Uncharacterized protein n=1 Tax=Allacma fusca TaxID=39272 RepID=A0A8J2JDV4_9HEXA|nr:unnamed protein product [Allacma fusca]